jgi:hypothetical protein
VLLDEQFRRTHKDLKGPRNVKDLRAWSRQEDNPPGPTAIVLQTQHALMLAMPGIGSNDKS